VIFDDRRGHRVTMPPRTEAARKGGDGYPATLPRLAAAPGERSLVIGAVLHHQMLSRRSRPSERALARNSGEKRVALELYRRFRRHLFDLGVVSLDRATQPLALPRLSAISAPCTSAGRVGMPEPRAMNIAVFMEEVMPINGLLMLCAVSNISASRPGQSGSRIATSHQSSRCRTAR